MGVVQQPRTDAHTTLLQTFLMLCCLMMPTIMKALLTENRGRGDLKQMRSSWIWSFVF